MHIDSNPQPSQPSERAVRRIDLTFQHPKASWESFLGVKLDESSYDILVQEDADVYTPEGDLLFRFRKRLLPVKEAELAFGELAKIKNKTNNRGMATGKVYADRKRTLKLDGTPTNTPRMPENAKVMSAIVGYFDRYPRTPYCRETAYNAEHAAKFHHYILPFLQLVDRGYQFMDGYRYAKQRMVVDKTSKDFVIPGTSFTTITVNQNFQTAVHTDQGDLKDGLSCILVLRAGEFQGGNLVFPHYRAAVRLDSCDLLLFDSHHMHGNTAIYGKTNSFKRVSLVCYYRERMIDCGTAAEELQRAKTRKAGETLHGR